MTRTEHVRLHTLLTSCGLPAPQTDSAVTAITADSRAVTPGAIFVAIKGGTVDGARFIGTAIEKGAIAIIGAPDLAQSVTRIPFIGTDTPRRALALLAAQLAGLQPSRIAAITGTNGKSSTADFVRQLWALQGRSSASLGTLGLIGAPAGVKSPPSLTTPDTVALVDTMADLARHGTEAVAIEASSHGLEQSRLDGLHLTAAGFSNLTRDHLDYHGTMEAYRAAKLRLFDAILPEGAIAAANADMDPTTYSALQAIAQTRGHRFRSVGLAGHTITLHRTTLRPQGQILDISALGRRQELELALPGRFQADNALLAAALSWDRDENAAEILALLPRLTGVRGRMELAATLPSGASAYVDYAHTPDALERLLIGLRPHAQGKLVVVFGAGGDRDRGKRPLMGEIATKHADLAIVTDDNPRSESPSTIRAEILVACDDAREIGDRRAAIAAGLEELGPGDVLVVAGKGHEQGQTIAGTIHPFDDRDTIRDLAGIAA